MPLGENHTSNGENVSNFFKRADAVQPAPGDNFVLWEGTDRVLWFTDDPMEWE